MEAVTRTDRFSWTVLEIKQIASEINMTLIKGRVARIYFPYNFITCFQETFTQSGFLLSDRNRLTAGTNAIKFGRQVSSQNITCKQLTFHVIFILICHDFDWSQLTVCVIIYISQSVSVGDCIYNATLFHCQSVKTDSLSLGRASESFSAGEQLTVRREQLPLLRNDSRTENSLRYSNWRRAEVRVQ